ncbi:MAG: J domain-containing protein, partial [Anaeromyxobacteraceae bacterium]|nr:J domain-containing protein [Anaeromyxobacteraceae bacterium]
MLVREISWDEVIRAGTVIFGVTFAEAAHAGGWRGELKTAYRRRVLETHPDRAAVLGRAEADLLAEFRAVSEAYELLARLRAG